MAMHRTITGWDDENGPRAHGDGVYVIDGKAWRVIGPRAIELNGCRDDTRATSGIAVLADDPSCSER